MTSGRTSGPALGGSHPLYGSRGGIFYNLGVIPTATAGAPPPYGRNGGGSHPLGRIPTATAGSPPYGAYGANGGIPILPMFKGTTAGVSVASDARSRGSSQNMQVTSIANLKDKHKDGVSIDKKRKKSHKGPQNDNKGQLFAQERFLASSSIKMRKKQSHTSNRNREDAVASKIQKELEFGPVFGAGNLTWPLHLVEGGYVQTVCFLFMYLLFIYAYVILFHIRLYRLCFFLHVNSALSAAEYVVGYHPHGYIAAAPSSVPFET